MTSPLKEFAGLTAVCLLVVAVGVSTALAASSSRKSSTKADVETTTTSDATDTTKNTGTITSYSGGKLTVKLYGGTKVKATVVRATDILVEPTIDDTADTGTSDDEDTTDTTDTTTTTTASTRHDGGGQPGDRGGNGYDEDLGPQEGDTSDVTVGRVVEVGDLHAGPKGLTWTEILLR